jgi:RimJ/RimL family protein N-acetyltransferase
MMNTITNTAAAPAFIPGMIDNPLVTLKHEIRTSHLYMRSVDESDLIEYIELCSDPAVMQFVGIEAGYIPSYKEIECIHSGAVQAWKTRGYGRWSLFDKNTNEFVGFCGFRSEQGKPELICMLHERFWGGGLAVESANACIDYGFESLGFTEVKAFTRPDHSRARRVMDKLEAEFTSYVDFHGVEGSAYLIKRDSIEF